MGTASAAIMLWSMLLSQSTQPVRVVGADNGRLTLSQSSRRFDRLVLLESTSEKAAALKLGAAVLRTVTGRPVDAKVELVLVAGDREAQQAELPALGQLWLRIKTELREDGPYDLPVPLAVDDRPLTFMFSLHRIKAAATVEVVGAQTVDTRCVRNDGEEGVCFWLTVNELAGHRQQMRLPTLLSLSRRENGNRLAAPRGELKVEGVNPVGWSLEPDASLPIQLFVTGLSRPGEYEGTIRFAAKDAQPVDRGFTVLLRDSLWGAVRVSLRWGCWLCTLAVG